MKLSKILMAALAVAGLSSCTDNEDGGTTTVNYTFEFGDSSLYTEDGYWADVYDEETTTLYVSPALAFSHTANAAWQSWTGFCPSSATETEDVSAESILTHQWSSVTGNGAFDSAEYLTCFWSSGEDLTDIPETPSCKIVLDATGASTEAIAQYVYVTNTNYSYWVMKNGCTYNKVFGTDDWCKVIFKGVKNDAITGTVEQYLAKDGSILNEWTKVDLSSLGAVDYIYVQMDSSDTSTWGTTTYMNNPSYFCLDNMYVIYNYGGTVSL